MKTLFCNILIYFVFSFLYLNSQDLELEYKNASEELNNRFKVLEYEKGRGWKQYKRWQSFWEPRFQGKRIDSRAEKLQIISYGEQWEALGPHIVPLNKLSYPSSGLGRINVIKTDPNNYDNIWLGTASGGLWKTVDGGIFWRYVEIPELYYPGIGDIAIPEDNSNMIFLASGDANGYFMEGAVSSGVYYSFNKGNTWNKSEIEFTPQKQGIINSIVCNTNASYISIATSFGIFISEDTCKTWEKVHTKHTRHLIKDVLTDSIYYATEFSRHGGSTFIKSTNYGRTWITKKEFENASRIRLTQSVSKPSRLYLVAVDANNSGLEGLYMSDDYGESWVKRNNIPNILGRNVDGDDIGGQGHYDLAITVHPNNPDILYVGGIHVWMSKDAGISWDIKNYWIGKYDKPYMHADQHDLVFIDTVLYSANDGGIYYSTDYGENWKDRSGGMNISQIYKIFVAKNYKDLIICGTQDNGASHSDRWNNWFHILGGDATYAEIDPESFSTLYIMSNNGVLNKTVDFGKIFKVISTPDELSETADWITPFQINYSNSNSIYLGYNNLWVTEDQGWTYRKLTDLGDDRNINNLQISNADTNFIYFSNYSNLYRYSYHDSKCDKLIEDSEYAISSILTDSSRYDTYYLAYSGFNDTLKVIKYENEERINLSDGLPNFPVNDLLHYKGKVDFLFAATDIGVFFRTESDNKWYQLGSKLPNTIITDLDIDVYSNRLIAATFGRGVWSYDLPQCEIQDLLISGDSVICPKSELVLESSRNDLTILWSNGITGTKNIVSEEGNYFYTALDNNLCVGYSDTLKVKLSDLPETIDVNESSDSLYVLDGFEYEWFYNDTLIASHNHNAIKKGKKGYYKVVVKDNYGCEVVSEKFFLQTSVYDTISQDRIELGPNPVRDFLYLNADPILEIKRIRILDLEGKIINEYPFSKKISLEELTSGTYTIQLESAKSIITYRVIKQ